MREIEPPTVNLSRMVRGVASLLLLQGLLMVEVQCQQTFPYVSFMGQTLANHSYVDISVVGNDVSRSNTVQCHTDLNTCCANYQGHHRGDWYFPDGERLQILGGPDAGNIFEARTAQRVDIHRINNHNQQTGIYRCDTPTVAVHHATDNSVRASVYVGLYTSTRGKVVYIWGDAVNGEILSIYIIVELYTSSGGKYLRS